MKKEQKIIITLSVAGNDQLGVEFNFEPPLQEHEDKYAAALANHAIHIATIIKEAL